MPSNLIEQTCFAPKAEVRLTAYADTIILDKNEKSSVISAVRFGGDSEMVQVMSDAIYGGAAIGATQNNTVHHIQSVPKGYRRQLSHDGIYAVATLMANDDAQTADSTADAEEQEPQDESQSEKAPPIQPRKCYIFAPAEDRDRLFEELDRKTARRAFRRSGTTC